ncbi:hypothetical protein ACFLSE_08785 [Bacteroidota bacterium]
MKTKLLIQTNRFYKTIALFSLAIFSLTFFACEESENLTNEDEYNNLINESYASEMFDEVEDLGDEAVDYLDNLSTKSSFETEGLNNYYRLSPCATVTRIFGQDTVNITIDFGDTNCLCNDGRERRGKIHINHYGFYWGDGEAEIEFYFEDYFVDNNQLIGTRNVFRYMNENQHRISEIISDGSIILAEDAGTITWHAERVREVVEGSETHHKYDDVIEITGSSYATLADGTEITGEITTPLRRINEAGCFRYFVSGVRSIMYGEDEITIDYGDGTCDNLAEFTRNGETHTYEIRHRRRFGW